MISHRTTTPVIAADGYYEAFSGFRSGAYLPESTTVSPTALGGSPLCIGYTAAQEIGYMEGANNYSKYGVFTNLTTGVPEDFG